MPTDPLDERIRALMADAVSAAPPAPSLSLQTPVPAGPSHRGWVWAGIGIAACVAAVAALVWTSGDDDRTIVGASTTTAAPSSSVEPSIAWPEGVAVLVASDRGIERVTSEGGQAVVTRVVDGVPVARAFETEDGSIVYQEDGGDMVILAADGSEQRQLPPGADSVPDAEVGASPSTLDDADAAGGGLRLVYRTPSTDPASSVTLWASFEPDEPVSTSPPGGFGVGYGRFSIVDDHTVMAATVDDTGQRSSFTFKFTLSANPQESAGESSASATSPMQLAGDGAGAVYELGADGIIRSHGAVSGVQVAIDRPEEVTALDVRSTWAAITRDGTAELLDMVSGDTLAVPVSGAGFVSVSRRLHTSTGPVPVTVPITVAPSTSVALPPAPPSMVTAGPDGVWEYGSDLQLQWTDEPMAFAVKAPDGSMLMQRQSGGYPGAGWTQADTLPLRQLNPEGPIVDLFEAGFPGADVVAGWWTLHDVALVDRQPLVLLDRQSDQVNIESPPGSLFLYDLASGGLTEMGPVGGWEAGVSRLHLAETGLIVGETYSEATRSFFAVRVDGSPAPTAADLGVDPDYHDCGDCPRLFTVSRDGITVAWLDGSTLRRWDLVAGAALPDVDLRAAPGAALDATNLSIGRFVAVYDRIPQDTSQADSDRDIVIVNVEGGGPEITSIGPASRSALI